MPLELLDNVVWNSLAGPHAHLAAGGANARRYARGLSPLTGFADPERPAFDELAPHTEAGEHLFCGSWPGDAPSGWRIDAEVPAVQMVWNGRARDADDGFSPVALAGGDVPSMLELVALTQPGPFGPRTIEMGEYFGVFEAGRLVAMAGERMWAGELREISGVATHPDRQGQGLARRLMEHLIRRQQGRGLVPFLHVMAFNTRAIGLYEHMGFRRHQQQMLRVVCKD